MENKTKARINKVIDALYETQSRDGLFLKEKHAVQNYMAKQGYVMKINKQGENK